MANYGIAIGINHYTPPDRMGLKELSGAIKDATDIYNWMLALGNVPRDNARLITSTGNPLNPIKNDVDTAITDLLKKILQEGANGDRFYFYFAGHGLAVEKDAENNGMCMANWTELMRDAASLSSKSYKQKFINEGLFKEVVMWLDCCRNTKVNMNPENSPGLMVLGKNANPKWFVGYATQYQSQAFEASVVTALGNETRGIFTRVLLEGLNGAAARNGKPINADDLRDHLRFHVPIEAQKAGYSQKPDVYHNTDSFDPMIFP